MWCAYEWAHHFFITANSFIKTNGCAVLGRGIAKEAITRHCDLPLMAGRHIKHACGHLGTYSCMANVFDKIGMFQVKYNWQDDADLDLIKGSVDKLAAALDHNSDITRVCLNFPGIGNGKLDYHDVLPIIQSLPDTVHVWTFA